jgi:hypothetical protein
MILTREQLYELVWSKPGTLACTQLGISDVALTKICRRLNVPKPPPGHWAKLQYGHQSVKPGLPPLSGEDCAQVTIDPVKHRFRWRSAKPPGVDGTVTPPPIVQVNATLQGCHPWVAATRRHFLPDQSPAVSGGVRGFLPITVSKPLLNRALRIMDAILRHPLSVGWEFEQRSYYRRSYLYVCRTQINFRLFEIEEVVPPNQPPGSKPSTIPLRAVSPRPIRRASGRLKFHILETVPAGWRTSWIDKPGDPLEDKLGEILDCLVMLVDRARQEEAARVVQHRIWDEKWRAQAEVERLKAIEDNRRKEFECASVSWSKAMELRRFIAACEQELKRTNPDLPLTDRQAEWLSWARAHADRLDPLLAGFLSRTVESIEPS